MDETYAVIVDIEVELVGEHRYTARSDEQGRFQFVDVADGNYDLRPVERLWKKAYRTRKLKLTPSKGHVHQHLDPVLRPRADVRY